MSDKPRPKVEVVVKKRPKLAVRQGEAPPAPECHLSQDGYHHSSQFSTHPFCIWCGDNLL